MSTETDDETMSTETDDETTPCPHCLWGYYTMHGASEDGRHGEVTRWQVMCEGCGATGPADLDSAAALGAWLNLSALRARAEAAEAKAKQAADDHDFLARQIGAAAVASTLSPGESLVRKPGETCHVIVGVVERLVARAHTAEATAARLNAANVRLMRRLGPALGAWKAAADELAKMGRRAVEAEAALATARAEGAAAERAAIVADLRSLAAAEDLCAAEAEMSENVGRGRINGGAIVRRGAAALRAAAGVIEGRRPVEGA